MAHEGLNTLDPTVVNRWVGEILKTKREAKESAARFRQQLGQDFDRAEGSGLNKTALKGLVALVEFENRHAGRVAGYSEEEREQLELLKTSMGDLGLWAAMNIGAPTEGSGRKRNAAAPGTVQAGMTLAEAKAILEKPKGRGRPSKERLDAERLIAEYDEAIAVDAGLKPGASGEQANAMAEAMGPDGGEDNVRDLRPRFAQTPPEAA